MRVLFLWAKINHHAHVRYSLIFWDIPNFGVRHDEDGVCALFAKPVPYFQVDEYVDYYL
jgi:hypothetical protein